MSLNSVNIGKTYGFETYSGARYANFKFVAILDAGTVVALGFDAPALHQQHYPYLPPGQPVSFTDYSYAKFVNPDNTILYLGIPWVKQSSMVESNSPGYRITIPSANQQQIDSVRSILIASGIEDFSIEPT